MMKIWCSLKTCLLLFATASVVTSLWAQTTPVERIGRARDYHQDPGSSGKDSAR